MSGPRIRRAVPEDREAVLCLLGAALGWGDDARFRQFFVWKHERGPFGTSPSWVATDAGRVVGFRTFLRWEFVGARRRVHRAVRAVDTATDPEHQGRGIFRALTLQAIDELASDGVEFVFNTPNSRSRPGYLAMGWADVGRLPASGRPLSFRAPWRMIRARVPAERWPQPSTAGRVAAEVLADPALDGLVAAEGPSTGLRTRRTSAYLRWRYGFGPLDYRALTLSDRLADGVAIFRLRKRGPAVECGLSEVLVPDGDPAATRALVRAVAARCGADYLLRLGGGLVDRSGTLRLPRLGPDLTWRPLRAGAPGASLGEWDLALGDVELL